MNADAGTKAEPTGRIVVNPDDYICLFEFFETFVAAENLSLPIKDAHREACDTLEKAVLNELTWTDELGVVHAVEFVIINIPPRIGKTKILEALACWMWAYFPEAQMIFTSYSSDLAETSLAYIRKVVQSAWYRDLFGDIVHVAKGDKLATIHGGNLFAEGTGGSLTGKGGGLKHECGGFIAIDDPAKPEEALSPVVSASVERWFENTLKDRRNSDRFCPIIICAQRLAPHDLPGYVEKTYPQQTVKVKFKALLDDGTSAFPETISAETLNAYKRTRTGRFVLASKYQQEPTSLGGNLIQTESFGRYDLDTADATEWEELYLTVDTAMKIKQWNDFSCAQLWGKKNKRAYLIDQIYGKWESPELLSCMTTFSQKCRDRFPTIPLRCLVELKAAGIGLVQQMNLLGIPAEGIERNIDKVMRVKGVLPFIESGLVFIPKAGSTTWVDGFETECGEFKEDGTAIHDDRVDAMVDGVEYTLGRSLSILDVLGGTV